MHSTHLRQEHIHGNLLGVAIGDALGAGRVGLSRRQLLRLRGGRRPLKYFFLPGRGIYGEATRLTMLCGQALLNSRSDSGCFKRAFQSRLSWYPFSLPIGAPSSTLIPALRAWGSFLRRVQTGINVDDGYAAPRAILSTLTIRGTGHRLVKWIDSSTRITHTNTDALDCCRVIATIADAGISVRPGSLDVHKTLEAAIAVSQQPEMQDKLRDLGPLLKSGRSPAAVARKFGWGRGVPGKSVPLAIMSAYCWLRSPEDFERVVTNAIQLGGKVDLLGAIAGGLCGAHVGQKSIPDRLRSQLGGYPHGQRWIENMAERFSHWPHGMEDLHRAPAQSSDPLMQIVRNCSRLPASVLCALRRQRYRLLTSSARR